MAAGGVELVFFRRCATIRVLNVKDFRALIIGYSFLLRRSSSSTGVVIIKDLAFLGASHSGSILGSAHKSNLRCESLNLLILFMDCCLLSFDFSLLFQEAHGMPEDETRASTNHQESDGNENGGSQQLSQQVILAEQGCYCDNGKTNGPYQTYHPNGFCENVMLFHYISPH